MVSNDFHTYLDSDDIEVFFRLYVLLYTDDTIIMAESPHELQSALDATFQFCSDWQLTINTLKTKIVIFSRGMKRNKPVFTYGGNALEIVNEYTYLGVTI